MCSLQRYVEIEVAQPKGCFGVCVCSCDYRAGNCGQEYGKSVMRWESALYACTRFSAWRCFDALVERTSLCALTKCPVLVEFLAVTLSGGQSDITPLSAGEALFLSLSRSPRSLKLGHGARICSEDAMESVPQLGKCGTPLTVRASLAVWGREVEEGLPVAAAVSVGRVDEWDAIFWEECSGEAGTVAGELEALFAEGGRRTRGFAGVVAGAMVTRGGVGVGLVGDGVVCVALCEEGEVVRVSRMYHGMQAAVALAAGLREGVRRDEEGLEKTVRRRVVEMGRLVRGKSRKRSQEKEDCGEELKL